MLSAIIIAEGLSCSTVSACRMFHLDGIDKKTTSRSNSIKEFGLGL